MCSFYQRPPRLRVFLHCARALAGFAAPALANPPRAPHFDGRMILRERPIASRFSLWFGQLTADQVAWAAAVVASRVHTVVATIDRQAPTRGILFRKAMLCLLAACGQLSSILLRCLAQPGETHQCHLSWTLRASYFDANCLPCCCLSRAQAFHHPHGCGPSKCAAVPPKVPRAACLNVMPCALGENTRLRDLEEQCVFANTQTAKGHMTLYAAFRAVHQSRARHWMISESPYVREACSLA